MKIVSLVIRGVPFDSWGGGSGLTLEFLFFSVGDGFFEVNYMYLF